MAITTDIPAHAGETVILSVPVYDADGDTKDLSAASAVSFVLALTGGSVSKSLSSGITVSTHTLRITVAATDTADAAAGSYAYQVYVTDADNAVACVADGDFVLEAKLS